MTSYRVNGMTCQGCARSVTNAIKAVSPVADVSIDLDAKTVSVNGLIDDAAVARAVEDAGFEFLGKV